MILGNGKALFWGVEPHFGRQALLYRFRRKCRELNIIQYRINCTDIPNTVGRHDTKKIYYLPYRLSGGIQFPKPVLNNPPEKVISFADWFTIDYRGCEILHSTLFDLRYRRNRGGQT